MPTKPTNATIPTSGPARYLRYLARRCVERPELLLDGARAAVSPRIAYLDLSRDTADSVLILSSQRSGSTLLAEVLAAGHRQRLVFEPLRGEAVGLSRHLKRGQYADPGVDDPDLDRLLRRVLSGRLRNLWVDRENASRLPQGRVIKDCLGTNLAPYVARHFPEVPLIYLLRHPVATAYSVVKLEWPDQVDELLEQRSFLATQFAPQLALIDEVAAGDRQSISCLVLRWCLENSLPVTLLGQGSAHVVFYEDLVAHPGRELARLAEFLQHRNPRLWSAWRPDPALLHRPSGTAWRDGDSTPTPAHRMAGWRSDVSTQTLDRSCEILAAFNLDRLYGPDPMPRVASADVLTSG